MPDVETTSRGRSQRHGAVSIKGLDPIDVCARWLHSSRIVRAHMSAPSRASMMSATDIYREQQTCAPSTRTLAKSHLLARHSRAAEIPKRAVLIRCCQERLRTDSHEPREQH